MEGVVAFSLRVLSCFGTGRHRLLLVNSPLRL